MPKCIGDMIDETDERLLALLSENARESVARIGRKLGLSRTTVQGRIERLERRGIIAGYTLRLASDYERGLVKADVMITALPKYARQVEKELRGLRNVKTLHSVSGQFDMIAVVTASTIAELDAAIDRIGEIEGVERTMSSIILSTRFER
ncbi:MAG TPA: Lrp/AsnC family transcriptional regulator [Rhizobiaceae bacterium]|jgi:DNA-binding Lrp family transcriptional regulator|nr:Lrp/AsnC family transcriptional regulator [Rhizobiaceae bacterium]